MTHQLLLYNRPSKLLVDYIAFKLNDSMLRCLFLLLMLASVSASAVADSEVSAEPLSSELEVLHARSAHLARRTIFAFFAVSCS
jgi:hypothetical protein